MISLHRGQTEAKYCETETMTFAVKLHSESSSGSLGKSKIIL